METIYPSLVVHTGSWGYLFHEMPSIYKNEELIYFKTIKKKFILNRTSYFHVESKCQHKPPI